MMLQRLQNTSALHTERSFFWKCLQVPARVLTTLLFDLKVYGRGNIPPTGGVLIVSNHQGTMDPLLLAVQLVRPLNYIAKSELFEGRFCGWFLRRVVNAVPVRLGSGDVGAVKETIYRLREGHLLNIYPEGRRTIDGEIAPLQKGVAVIIRRARVPVIPAVIVGSFEAWPIHRRWFRCHPIRIEYGPVMNLTSLSDEEVLQRIDRTLRGMFEQLRERSRRTERRFKRRRGPSARASGNAT